MNAHPHPHRYAGYVRPHTGAELSRMVGDPDACFRDEEGERVWSELCRFNREHPRLDGPARHERIGEQTLLDLFAGIAFWFLVGIAPALCVLAIMVLAK